MKKVLTLATIGLLSCEGRVVPLNETPQITCKQVKDGLQCQASPEFIEQLRGEPGMNGRTGLPGPAGAPGSIGPMGRQGPAGVNGVNGNDGRDAKECITLRVYRLAKGDCVEVGTERYAENEGSKVDIYNNNTCDHHPEPKTSLCNDITSGHVCYVGTTQYSAEGTGDVMWAYALDVSGECAEIHD